jgi:hypothetical protein
MVAAVFILALLTVVASLASWLFGQWLTRPSRISGAALALGGGGTLLLIATVAVVTIGAATWWRQLLPMPDSSPPIEPAPSSTRQHEDPPPAQTGFSELKAARIAMAERHLERRDYPRAIDVAQRYLADHPGDPEMTSLLARAQFAAQYPGAAVIHPQWSATDCVASTYSAGPALWMLDNGCGRVVAVLFASCVFQPDAAIACVDQKWNYEPTGILMTAANDRPVPLRLGKDGPLVAPIFTIRDAAGSQRRIRYLACEVTAPGVLQLLRSYGGEDLTQERLVAELRADACYSRVLDWTRTGHRYGKSPDTLLRTGVD